MTVVIRDDESTVVIGEGGRGAQGPPGTGGFPLDARSEVFAGGIVVDGAVGHPNHTDNLPAFRAALAAWTAQGGGEAHFPYQGTGVMQLGSTTVKPQAVIDADLLDFIGTIDFHGLTIYLAQDPGWDEVAGTNLPGSPFRIINGNSLTHVRIRNLHIMGPDRQIAINGFAKNPYIYNPDLIGVGIFGGVGRVEFEGVTVEGCAVGKVIGGDHYKFANGCQDTNNTINRFYDKTENQKDDTSRGDTLTRARLASMAVHPWFDRITDNALWSTHMGQGPIGFYIPPTGLPRNDGETVGTFFRSPGSVFAGAHDRPNYSDQCSSGEILNVWSPPDGAMGQPVLRTMLFGTDTIIETVKGVVRTLEAHDLNVDDPVTIDNSNVNQMNGDWFVESVPTPDTFTISATLGGPQANRLQSGPGGSILTLNDGVFSVIGGPHALLVDDEIAVQNIGPAVDGGYFVVDTPTPSSFVVSDTLGGPPELVGVDAVGGSATPLGSCDHARLDSPLPSGDQTGLVFAIERHPDNYRGNDGEAIVNCDWADTTVENAGNYWFYDGRRRPQSQIKWQSHAGTIQLSGLDAGCQFPLSLADPATPKYQGDNGHLFPATDEDPGRFVDPAGLFASGPEPVLPGDYVEMLGLQIVSITNGVVETSKPHHLGQNARLTIYGVVPTPGGGSGNSIPRAVKRAYWVREVVSPTEFTLMQQQAHIDPDTGVVTLGSQQLTHFNGTGGYISRAGADALWIDSSTSPPAPTDINVLRVQVATPQTGSAITTRTATLPSPPAIGNVLIARFYSNLGPTHITPPAGYQLLGIGGSSPGIGALYGKIADGSPGEDTATVTADAPCFLGIELEEWEGVTLPADASGTLAFLNDASQTVDTSDCTTSGSGVALAVGYVTAGDFTGIAAAGWTVDAIWGRAFSAYQPFTLAPSTHAELAATWTNAHKGNITVVVLPPVPSDGPYTVKTKLDHGLEIGEEIAIQGHELRDLEGIWNVATIPSAREFTLVGVTGQGAGGTNGYVRKRTPRGFFENEAPFFMVTNVVDDTTLDLEIDPGADVGAGIAYRVVKQARQGGRIGQMIECDMRWSHGETLNVATERLFTCTKPPLACRITFASPRHLAAGSYFEEPGGEPPLFQIIDFDSFDLQDFRTVAVSGDRELQLVRGAPGQLFRRGAPAAYTTDGRFYLAGPFTEDDPILIGAVQFTAGWAQTLAWVVLKGGMYEVALAVPTGAPLGSNVYPDLPQPGGEATGFCLESTPSAVLDQPFGKLSGPVDDLIVGYTPVDVRRGIVPKVLAQIDGGIEP